VLATSPLSVADATPSIGTDTDAEDEAKEGAERKSGKTAGLAMITEMPEETEAEKQEARLALLAPVRRVRSEDTGEEVAFVRVGRGAVLGLEVLPSYLCAPGAGAWRNDTAGGVVGTPARATAVVVEDVKATCFSAFAFPDVVRAADATAEAAMGFMAHSSLLQVPSYLGPYLSPYLIPI
jgi:hypothetical protein